MALPDDSWRIDTPENVAFDYEVAGIGSRFMAALVDTTLILVLQVLVNLTLFLVARAAIGGDLSESRAFMWLVGLFGLISFAFLWGYYVLFEALWNGQSPGKRWAGLRVIRTDGLPISLSESVIRNLVRLVDFLPLYYGVGVVVMFLNAQARRLGDLAAGTIVVRDRAAVTLESLAQPRAPWPALDVPALDGLPVERLTSLDIEAAEEYLRRRGGIVEEGELARRMALLLLKKMGVPAERLPEWHPLNLIRGIVQAYRRRGEGGGETG